MRTVTTARSHKGAYSYIVSIIFLKSNRSDEPFAHWKQISATFFGISLNPLSRKKTAHFAHGPRQGSQPNLCCFFVLRINDQNGFLLGRLLEFSFLIAIVTLRCIQHANHSPAFHFSLVFEYGRLGRL
jgi:hypothetical protein